MKFVKNFSEIVDADSNLVGGKTASLGLMYNTLASQGIRVPGGFGITSDAYWHFVNSNHLMPIIEKIMDGLTDYSDVSKIQEVGQQIRNLFHIAPMPADLAEQIQSSYVQLGMQYNQKNIHVAVRSSATAEDLPDASFAGQQDTFLNISGKDALFDAVKKCFASLFTDRAIVYRHEKSFDYKSIALSVTIQKMVRSDKAVSGVAFSIDTETGFENAMIINASYGLGEAIVQGLVVPDEYVVFKPTNAILKKDIGSKKIKVVYKPEGTVQASVPTSAQAQQCLSDQEILILARMINTIEQFYIQKGMSCAVDVEWAKDGLDNELYIVQARPETVHSQKKNNYIQYKLTDNQNPLVLVSGNSVGQQIAVGKAVVVNSVNDIQQVQPGDIIVTNMTDPDWVPVLRKSSGIITQMGGRTCHAAIVSRELHIPALVGAHDAMQKIKNGQEITIDCSQGTIGFVYDRICGFEKNEVELANVPEVATDIMINLADPERAFALSKLPVSGVGLARIEFIINNSIKVHPLALLYPETITDKKVLKQIDGITDGYTDKKAFFVDKLTQGISLIAAAFYPKPVIVRLSDFKSNEYRNLIGGSFFEPQEENPMIGFRGASRYYSDRFKDAFALECAALSKARTNMGLTNIKVMVPFVRTLQEGKKVIQEMALHGLQQGIDGLEIIMMCEIPSNVILVEEFLKDFDGISIGSNDLTQLTLGIDRDSALLQGVFDERDPAMKKMFARAIEGAKRAHKYSGICGQAPSDYPELADYLISLGIKSISLNPDTVIPFLMRYKVQEEIAIAIENVSSVETELQS